MKEDDNSGDSEKLTSALNQLKDKNSSLEANIEELHK
eukprot:CAMPEP_0170510568 /NCGR_PEP_ID=MMETSP0208-20121228/65839_1 /TAXON_ID=197538 /ORGANISM="Strombidium inclinatum, Strain S3" /LENGTH=36 /DNA_ID= /DNA_START= /DNA_END= /DNA_ORIENTATION=